VQKNQINTLSVTEKFTFIPQTRNKSLQATKNLAAAACNSSSIHLQTRINSPSNTPYSSRVETPAYLGHEAALDLAQRGGTVVLACRNMEAGRRAADSIRSLAHNDDVHCMELDLSSFDSIRKFASEVKRRYSSIYAVVCNAGVWIPMEQQKKTKEGYEIHFGVNHLGHFLLIQDLIPHMIQRGQM
jgi:hypothetical protein